MSNGVRDGGLERGLPVADGGDRVALAGERAREHVAQRRVVVDDEDAQGGGGRGAHRASRTMTTHAAALMSVTPTQRMLGSGERGRGSSWRIACWIAV